MLGVGVDKREAKTEEYSIVKTKNIQVTGQNQKHTG